MFFYPLGHLPRSRRNLGEMSFHDHLMAPDELAEVVPAHSLDLEQPQRAMHFGDVASERLYVGTLWPGGHEGPMGELRAKGQCLFHLLPKLGRHNLLLCVVVLPLALHGDPIAV
jgi:hypothetical protein